MADPVDGVRPDARSEHAAAVRAAWSKAQRVFNSRAVREWYREQIGTPDAELPDRSLLTAIADLGPIRLTDLAETVGRNTSGMSKVVQGLVESGYVARIVPDYDRRVTLLEATDVGHAVVRSIKSLDLRVIGRHVETFDDADLATFVQLLERFADRIVEWERSVPELLTGTGPDGANTTATTTEDQIARGN